MTNIEIDPPDPTMFSMSALMARQTRQTLYSACVQAKKSGVLSDWE